MVCRILLIVTLLVAADLFARAGTTPDTAYTVRGKTDFDTVLQRLNPYGTWTKVDNRWAYLPSDHGAPYTDGRWKYTEYGWYWDGRRAHSWATEHYGYWKRTSDKTWLWYPGPYWLPEAVEIRASNSHLGWRSGAVDDSGAFVEQPLDRFAKNDEWTFVTLAQFANAITPGIAASADEARKNLEESTDCRHTYTTYRVIDRPGPHPADLVDLCKEPGMVAPKLISDKATELAPKLPATNAPVANVPAATNMTGTNAPALLGTVDPSADPRKVKYWVTMSLPTFWAQPPPDAKPDQLYIYRPEIFQDQDGIERRISLWFNPQQRTSLKDLLSSSTSEDVPSAATPAPGLAETPAIPAVPPEAKARDPFASPLSNGFQADTAGRLTNAPSRGGVPAGRQR